MGLSKAETSGYQWGEGRGRGRGKGKIGVGD